MKNREQVISHGKGVLLCGVKTGDEICPQLALAQLTALLWYLLLALMVENKTRFFPERILRTLSFLLCCSFQEFCN